MAELSTKIIVELSEESKAEIQRLIAALERHNALEMSKFSMSKLDQFLQKEEAWQRTVNFPSSSDPSTI